MATNKVDKSIRNLQMLLSQQPDKIENNKVKLQIDMKHIEYKIKLLKEQFESNLAKLEHKLAKKKEELESTTLENDSYTIYLKQQIADREEQRNRILKKQSEKQIKSGE